MGVFLNESCDASRVSGLLHEKRNLISSLVAVPVYKLKVSYFTKRGNYKTKTFYYLGYCPYDSEFEDYYFLDDVKDRIKKELNSFEVDSFERIGNVILDVAAGDSAMRAAVSDDSNGVLLNELKAVHPQVLVTDRLHFPIEEISMSYETVRGNLRTVKKYLVHHGERVVSDVLFSWVDDYNKRYPYRAFLNVNFLGNERIGTVSVA